MGTRMDDIIARVTSQTSYSNLLAGDQFGFLSAKQYGAVGDGATDDSTAILSMLSVASASTYKALYFPTGVYKVDNVTLKSSQLSNYYCFGDNASFSGITLNIEQIGNKVGNLSDLLTSNTSNIVGAINEVKAESVVVVLTTRGDTIVQDSTDPIKLGIGTPLQYIVAGNTSDDTPLKYLDSPQKVMTAKGDMIRAASSNTIERLPASTGAGVLSYQVSSSAPTWVNGTNLQYPVVGLTTDVITFYDSPQKLMTGVGSMIFSSAANAMTELTKPNTSEGRILQYTTAPSWQVKTNMEVITSTSGYVWSPPKSGSYKVTIVGGGGAGGNIGSATIRGSGGGAGGTSIGVLVLSSSESITVTVGAGGVFTPSTSPTAGGSGATSSFGIYLSATGGRGGGVNQNNVTHDPGTGGIGIGGTININGGGGLYSDPSSTSLNCRPGGGSSIFGNALAYGAGGYGGIAGTYVGTSTELYLNTTTNLNSYAIGRNGVCIIEY